MREAASWLLDHRQTIGPAIWEVLCHLHGACSPREVHLLLGTPERTIRRHLARLRPLLAGQPQNQRPKMAAPQRPKMAATSHQRPKMAAPPIKERARARTDRQIPIPFQNQNPSVSPDFLHQLLALVPTDLAGAVKVRDAAPQLDEAQVLMLCRQIAAAAPRCAPIRSVNYLVAALPARAAASQNSDPALAIEATPQGRAALLPDARRLLNTPDRAWALQQFPELLEEATA